MTTITAPLVIDVAGLAADDVADALGVSIDAGELDQAMTNVIRQHLANMHDTRDWRIVAAHAWPQGEEPTL